MEKVSIYPDQIHVIVRREKDGELIAVLPQICATHNPYHFTVLTADMPFPNTASYEWYRETKPVDDKEANELIEKLKKAQPEIFADVILVKRMTRKHLEFRKSVLEKFK